VGVIDTNGKDEKREISPEQLLTLMGSLADTLWWTRGWHPGGGEV